MVIILYFHLSASWPPVLLLMSLTEFHVPCTLTATHSPASNCFGYVSDSSGCNRWYVVTTWSASVSSCIPHIVLPILSFLFAWIMPFSNAAWLWFLLSSAPSTSGGHPTTMLRCFSPICWILSPKLVIYGLTLFFKLHIRVGNYSQNMPSKTTLNPRRPTWGIKTQTNSKNWYLA